MNSLMVGRCAGAQCLGGPYHGGRLTRNTRAYIHQYVVSKMSFLRCFVSGAVGIALRERGCGGSRQHPAGHDAGAVHVNLSLVERPGRRARRVRRGRERERMEPPLEFWLISMNSCELLHDSALFCFMSLSKRLTHFTINIMYSSVFKCIQVFEVRRRAGARPRRRRLTTAGAGLLNTAGLTSLGGNGILGGKRTAIGVRAARAPRTRPSQPSRRPSAA